MSSNEVNQNAPNVHMESIDRIAHLPAVEQTVQAATTIYGKVKDSHYVTHWTLSTAESTVQKAIEISKPVVNQLEGPIKKVDDLLCTGLDYVEEKIPAVKLPPGEMYTTTKDYVNNKIQPAIQTARGVVDPAVQVAMQVMEPAVKMAEPIVQPAMVKACALKDYGYQKVEELLNLKPSESENKEDKPLECNECVENKPKSIHSE